MLRSKEIYGVLFHVFWTRCLIKYMGRIIFCCRKIEPLLNTCDVEV